MSRTKLSTSEIEALKYIRNYIAHHNLTPSLRKIMQALNYKSPRSASLILEKLIEAGYITKKSKGGWVPSPLSYKNGAETIDIPLVGEIVCGKPVWAEENREAVISVSTEIAKPPHKYFLLRAKGDSMDEEGINDGDLLLVRQDIYAKDGDIVVALVDGGSTVKEFHNADDAIILKPHSKNKEHQPIIVTADFQIQGVVVKVLGNF